MVNCKHPNAVRSDEATVHSVHCFNYAFFELCSLFTFLTETCRNNDECFGILFLRQHLNGIRTIFCSYCQHSQINVIRQIINGTKGFYILNIILLGINNKKLPSVITVDDIFQYLTTGLVYVVGTADNNYLLWVYQLLIDHFVSLI